MKKRALFYGFIVLLLLVLLLPACTQVTPTTSTTKPPTTTTTPPTSTTKPPSTTLTPQYGGVLKIIARGTITNLGYPAGKVFTGDDGTFNSPAVEKLITLDAKGNLIPWLATGWQISPDYKYITLTLRKGVKFHDGTDFNAAAAKFNLDLYIKGVRPDLKTISSVDIVDDYTIKLNYATYDPALLSNLVFAVGHQVSPTAINKNGIDWAMNNPIGTGPYKFVSYKRDVSVEYVRFDDYWGGKPYLDGMQFVLITDPVTALASFKAGEAQSSIIVGLKDAAEMQSTGKFNVITCVAGVDAIAPDSVNSTSPFYDVRVRQAVAYAIDNAAIAKTVSYGFYPAANQLAAPGGDAYNPAIVGYPYNPQKAKQLLADAGYASGIKTNFIVWAAPEHQDMAAAVQAYLSAVGIDVRIDITDTSRYMDSRNRGWNNALFFPFRLGTSADPGRTYMTSLSSKRSRYVSVGIPDDYDKALLAANVEADAQKRQAQFQSVMKMAVDQYCLVIPLYLSSWVGVSTPQVHDFTLNGIAVGVWHPESVWLSK